MGAFYTNVVLRGPDQRQVVQFMTKAKRPAYVSPTIDGLTVVYDEKSESQDETTLSTLASQLSKAFGCTALAVLVHDSDVFAYWLFEAGELTDEYNSMPGYFDDPSLPPLGGDSDRLCAAFGVEDGVDRATSVFHKVASRNPEDDWAECYVFAEEVHRDLAELLGIPPFAVSTGYHYIEQDDLPEGLDWGSLVECP
jgi:hypothetical protein